MGRRIATIILLALSLSVVGVPTGAADEDLEAGPGHLPCEPIIVGFNVDWTKVPPIQPNIQVRPECI